MKYDFDLENHHISRKTILKILITIVEIALVVFAAYAITHYGLETMKVSGEYMSPTLKDGDEILINKMSYYFHRIHRNDVVVVQESGSEHNYFTLERVIGLPGETVQIKDGEIYIDGEKLNEELDFPSIENGGLALEEITLEEDEYFMLGDNRNECEDSRNANIGNIARKDIVGKAWIRLNSFAFISQIDGFSSGGLIETTDDPSATEQTDE